MATLNPNNSTMATIGQWFSTLLNVKFCVVIKHKIGSSANSLKLEGEALMDLCDSKFKWWMNMKYVSYAVI